MRYLINTSSVKPLSHNDKYSETKTFKKKPRVFKIMIYFQHRLSTETCDTRQDQSVSKKSIFCECRVSYFTYKTTLVSWGLACKARRCVLVGPNRSSMMRRGGLPTQMKLSLFTFYQENTTWKRYDIVFYIFFLRG